MMKTVQIERYFIYNIEGIKAIRKRYRKLKKDGEVKGEYRMAQKKMFQVIFDMDGVIFDSEKTLLQCWLDTAKKYNIDAELVRDTYIQCIGTNLNQSTEIYRNALSAVFDEKQIWNLWEESFALYQKRYPEYVFPLKPGVREILKYLQDNHIPVGIASSSAKALVEKEILSAGLSDYFVGCIGGDAVTISKPDPEIYLLACRFFHFAPSHTFAIEDSYNGIRSASAAGLRAIMVPDIVEADAKMERLAERVCGDLFEVKDYFSAILEEEGKQGIL